MGRPKATIEVGGLAMATRAAAALRGAGLGPIWLVGGEREVANGLGLEWFGDRWPGEGPLGGVITALHRLDGTDAVAAVVVACDMPLVSVEAVTALRGSFAAVDAVVAVANGVRQPLLARYQRQARAELEAVFARGERSLQTALESLRVAEVVVDAGVARSIDTPRELDEVRAEVIAGAAGGHIGDDGHTRGSSRA
jgi:molybdopterin-guanine dinucleotide biosynthesis protein A